MPSLTYSTRCDRFPTGQGPARTVSRVIHKASNNRRLLGGLPHSEISGSKGILTSPELIAEYHVLHRLLLPRHSPNALKALDSIQKKKVYCRIWKPNSNGVWQLKSKGLTPTRTV